MPRTEAGKRLLQWFKSEVYNPGMSYDPDDFGEDVDAIEAEARLPIQRRRSERLQTLVAEAVAAERARIMAAVKAAPVLVLPTGTYIDVEYVFDAID